VGLDLEKTEPAALEGFGGAMCQPAGERGFSCTRRSHEKDHAMQGDDAAVDLAAHCEVQHRLGKELSLQTLFQDDRVPERAERGIGKPARALDPLWSVEILPLHRSQLLHRQLSSARRRLNPLADPTWIPEETNAVNKHKAMCLLLTIVCEVDIQIRV
jgi:hypothetical protein